MAEAYANAGALNTGNSATVGGRRLKTGKKLRLVKKKTVRKMLAKKGLRMRGGAAAGGVPNDQVVTEGGELKDAVGGRRRRRTGRKGKKSRSRKFFGVF
jgi:hypothetical protein